MTTARADSVVAPWTPTAATVIGASLAERSAAAALLRIAGFGVWSAGSSGELAGPCDGVVVLLTSGNDAERVREVRTAAEAHPEARIIAVMPEQSSNAVFRRALLAGAAGIVLDDQLERALVATAQALVAGQMAVPGVLGRQLAPRPLSHREKQILSLVVLGLTNREIARKLFLAESTVKTHLSSAFRKIDARSRSEAVARIQDPETGLRRGHPRAGRRSRGVTAVNGAAPERCDIAVIGAGIVGLATARELARRHPHASIAVIDKETEIGRHQTGHNSGVIHAGIYYAPGSLKAQLCVSGARELYAYCDEHGIPVERCGKLIVALDASELPGLEELERRGRANGVPGLRRIGAGELRELEPAAARRRRAALPGHRDRRLRRRGACAARRPRAGRRPRRPRQRGHRAQPERPRAEDRPRRRRAARRPRARVRRRLVGPAGRPGGRARPSRGSCRSAAPTCACAPERRHLVRSLIYPVPDPRLPFLGVHLTTPHRRRGARRPDGAARRCARRLPPARRPRARPRLHAQRGPGRRGSCAASGGRGSRRSRMR